MLDAFWSGLIQVLSWPAPGYLLLGVLIGMWIGAVPGLGGVLGLVILIPFTYNMDAVSAFALLLGMYAVTTTSDTISSVLLGVPGTAASQATVLDGYPLAKQGQAERAFGAAFTCSAVGGVLGALVLAASLPLVRPIILFFGSPEFFMIGVLALTLVGSLSGASILKGLAIALFGLLLATIGYSSSSAVPRYWFGWDYLLDGLPLIPIVLGVFALPEILELAVRDRSVAAIPQAQRQAGGMLAGIKDAILNRWLVLRSSAIGMYVGLVPGIGGSIVDWMAYAHAVHSAKDKSKFGQGDIRGVIAPEAANNSFKGAELIPTVAFGIPGSAGMAVLLGALLIQGLRPGPSMLTTNVAITFSMVWTLVIANVAAAFLLMLWSRQIARVAFLPGHLVVPGVMLFMLMGAWLATGSIGDLIVFFAMGVVGFVMKRGGWPRPPLILGFVLCPIMENSFQLSMRAFDGLGWLLRPGVLAIAVLAILAVILSARGVIKTKRDAGMAIGEGSERAPLLSVPLSVLLAAAFAGAIIAGMGWPARVKQFPMVIAIPGLALGLALVARDLFDVRNDISAADSVRKLLARTVEATALRKSAEFLLWILATILLTYFLGQLIAIPIFIAAYLLWWGRYEWYWAALYALGGLGILFFFYKRILNVLLLQPFWLS